MLGRSRDNKRERTGFRSAITTEPRVHFTLAHGAARVPVALLHSNIDLPSPSTKSLAFQAWHDISTDHAVMSTDETRRPNIAEETWQPVLVFPDRYILSQLPSKNFQLLCEILLYQLILVSHSSLHHSFLITPTVNRDFFY
jgi:hypothetical protein